jgi:hypothetical protein
MRRIVVPTLVALSLVVAVSVSAETTRETTTTTYSGTVSELSPSRSTIVLKSDESPQTVNYVYNDKTVWLDSAGNQVTMETVRNQPVTIYYQRDGDQMVVTKVVTHKSLPSKVIEQKSTTTRTMDVPE